VRSGDLAIAYQVHGSGPHDVLFNGSAAANVDTVWDFPEAARLFERLGRFARVIHFDRRDTGLSDPVNADLTLEAHVQDALAVMDATGASRPVLLGNADAARSLAVLAATHPARVAALVLVSPSARSFLDVSGTSAAFGRASAELDAFAPLADLFAPDYAADPVRSQRLERGLQSTLTPFQVERLLDMSRVSDVTSVLPLVQAPTLVLQPAGARSPGAAVREFADLIPGARFRELPGADMFIVVREPDGLADAVEEFVTGTTPAPVTNRVLATVLFTDLVDSTRRAAKAGDRAWAALLARHLADTRTAVAAHGGETVKSTGDGVLALFTGPAHGVRCAQEVIAAAHEAGLELRTGLHTGEVERSGEDVAGLAVHLAARIMSLAGAGEILVSRTVKDLVIGSELRFTERGEHELKGIPDRWPVYAVA
jgi:class 3 adenylate cyclase